MIMTKSERIDRMVVLAERINEIVAEMKIRKAKLLTK
jgi:hypothetical protein